MPFDESGLWRPNPKQEKFLCVPDTIKEAFYGGGAGSGKTELLLMLPIIREWYKAPSFKQVFLRRTFSEIRNEVEPRSKLIYPRFGGEYNKSDKTWTFESGAMVMFGHCEHEDDVHQYDSMEINLFTPDELTTLTEFIYLYIALTRVRSSDRKLPALIRASGMPGGIGHTWVKKRFVDPAKQGNKIIVGKGGLKRIFVFATQDDNRDHIDPTYRQSLEALPEAEKQAKLHGSFDAYLGQVFDEFRDRHHPDEPLNALHVVDHKTTEIPEWWPKICCGDWGFKAQTWVGWGAISPHKQLIVYREQVFQKTYIEEWAPYVKEYILKENPRVVKFCRSVRQNKGQEHTVEQQINDALGVQIELSVNNHGTRIAGKQLLHEYLRWKPKHIIANPKKPEYDGNYAAWLLRNRGMKEYDSYLKSFIEAEQEVLPKLLIFDTCPALINAIKACVYDKTNIEDVAEFDGDDPYDGIRYMVDTADRYFDEAVGEYEFMKKKEEILAKAQQQEDQHIYYMSMRMLEAQKDNFKPVRRYHHR